MDENFFRFTKSKMTTTLQREIIGLQLTFVSYTKGAVPLFLPKLVQLVGVRVIRDINCICKGNKVIYIHLIR